MSAGEVLLTVVGVVIGFSGVVLLCWADWNGVEDLGRVSDGWRRRQRRDEE
jgi:hypothetical protein